MTDLTVIKSPQDFSRKELDWLDWKFEKKSVDRIVTLPVQLGRVISEERVVKIYVEFFSPSKRMLKKDGKIGVCMKRGINILQRCAKEAGFVLERELEVKQGKDTLQFLLFGYGSV